ncbi:unnamed protein product [Thlaspi arvense]|uniref:Uncharacterized protein n=1 Tax=Thlaspi arvense TaxID=13288 RepID=A0AAU9SE30_THLAR|nr:unnamed protein product [Thlaspi arvense]
MTLTKKEKERLKYLEFVQVAVEALCSHLRKGKRQVWSIEGAIKTVVGPVYQKYHDVLEVLKNMDQKVDMYVIELDHRFPPIVKQLTPIVACAFAFLARCAGSVETASGIAKSVYSKYEPAAKELYASYKSKIRAM